jgi:large subunit ribosomal protein L7/L12
MAKTAAERLADLEERRAKLNVEIQRVRAREKKQRQRDDTRRKILLGSLLMSLVKRGDLSDELVQQRLDQHLTRPEDRKLFQLDVEESEGNQGNQGDTTRDS